MRDEGDQTSSGDQPDWRNLDIREAQMKAVSAARSRHQAGQSDLSKIREELKRRHASPSSDATASILDAAMALWSETEDSPSRDLVHEALSAELTRLASDESQEFTRDRPAVPTDKMKRDRETLESLRQLIRQTETPRIKLQNPPTVAGGDIVVHSVPIRPREPSPTTPTSASSQEAPAPSSPDAQPPPSRKSAIVLRLVLWASFGVVFGLCPLIVNAVKTGMSPGGLELDGILATGELFVAGAVIAGSAIGELVAAMVTHDFSGTTTTFKVLAIFVGFAALLAVLANTAGYAVEASPETISTTSQWFFIAALIPSGVIIAMVTTV